MWFFPADFVAVLCFFYIYLLSRDIGGRPGFQRIRVKEEGCTGNKKYEHVATITVVTGKKSRDAVNNKSADVGKESKTLRFLLLLSSLVLR